MESDNSEPITSPGEMSDAFRSAQEGSRIAVTLADRIEVDADSYTTGRLVIESIREQKNPSCDTTADRQIVLSGAVTKAVDDGEIDHWKIVCDHCDDQWEQPTITGWYWDGLDYKSTPPIPVETLSIRTVPDSGDTNESAGQA